MRSKINIDLYAQLLNKFNEQFKTSNKQDLEVKQTLREIDMSFRKLNETLALYSLKCESPYSILNSDMKVAIMHYQQLLKELNKPKIKAKGAPKRKVRKTPHPLSIYKNIRVTFISVPMK